VRPETSNRPQRHPPPTWRGVPVAPACDSIARATIPPRGDATRRRDAPRASKIRATKNPKYISRARTHRVPRDVDGNPTARSNESQNVGLILEIERVRARGGRFRLFGGITHRDGARSRRRFSLDRSSALSRSLVDARREVTRRPTARAISIARIAVAFVSRCRRSMTHLSRVMTRRRFEHISHISLSPLDIFHVPLRADFFQFSRRVRDCATSARISTHARRTSSVGVLEYDDDGSAYARARCGRRETRVSCVWKTHRRTDARRGGDRALGPWCGRARAIARIARVSRSTAV